MPSSRALLALVAAVVAALASGVVTSACASAPKCPPASAGERHVEVALPSERPLTAAAAVDAPAAPMTEEMAKASATLDHFHAAAAAADEEAYFGLFAEGGVFLGTDGKERWTVPQFRAYAHPRFASGKAWSFRAKHRELSVRGDIAWFDEELDTPNLGPSRGSGVLVRDPQGAWKVAQYNLSVPIPNERFAAVKKIIAGTP